jgi:putative FmdB family regulatory protein
MPMYDFQCSKGHEFEDISAVNEPVVCPKCGEKAERIWRKVAKTLVEIIPSYPGCNRQRAGYVHTAQADHPATKVQSGYGGMCNPPV